MNFACPDPCCECGSLDDCRLVRECPTCQWQLDKDGKCTNPRRSQIPSGSCKAPFPRVIYTNAADKVRVVQTSDHFLVLEQQTQKDVFGQHGWVLCFNNMSREQVLRNALLHLVNGGKVG